MQNNEMKWDGWLGNAGWPKHMRTPECKNGDTYYRADTGLNIADAYGLRIVSNWDSYTIHGLLEGTG